MANQGYCLLEDAPEIVVAHRASPTRDEAACSPMGRQRKTAEANGPPAL